MSDDLLPRHGETLKRASRKKTKKQALMESLQRAVEEKFGIKNFDPVVLMALIAVEAMEDRTVEVNGQEVVFEADKALAANTLAKIASYVHPTLKAVEVTGEDGGPIQVDVEGAKDRLASMLLKEE